MNEKKGCPFFLRWPWNIVIDILLVLVLRIFAVPVILLLLWLQHKENPHGTVEGYCLSRTRKRLSWGLWSLLLLLIGAGLGAAFLTGLGQDRSVWETMDYVTFVVAGAGMIVMFLLAIYMGYIAIRDTFFPAKSGLADSIRRQLPYPEEAPPVEKLFAMVDQDLKAHGLWFGAVGIGDEWVLGELANRIDRIRGIFTVDEIHRHHTQTGVRTSRTLQLILIDNRWQRNVTNFSSPKDLREAAEYLSLRVPGARCGNKSQYQEFWQMDEMQRQAFERDFRQKMEAGRKGSGWSGN